MARIFISYRRADTVEYAGRLSDLIQASKHEVFIDVTSRSPGEEFADAIARTINQCHAVIVLIGPQWLSISDAAGQQRINTPYDFVRLEIAAALQQGTIVIPVLVDGAMMPSSDQLPDDLKTLAWRNAFVLGVETFQRDAEQLLKALLHVLKDENPAPIAEALQPPPLANLSASTVFVSYSRSDWEPFVSPLVEHLRAEGLTIWVDQHLLQGGQDWLDEINRAAQLCRCMVLCVSPVAMDSKYVKMEYRYFIDEDKPIIPVMCSETELPIELRGLQYLHHSDRDKITQRVRHYLTGKYE